MENCTIKPDNKQTLPPIKHDKEMYQTEYLLVQMLLDQLTGKEALTCKTDRQRISKWFRTVNKISC